MNAEGFPLKLRQFCSESCKELQQSQSGLRGRAPFSHRIYLRIDQAVKKNPIDDSGKVILPGQNRTLFDTGPDTVWDTDTPDVKAPK